MFQTESHINIIYLFITKYFILNLSLIIIIFIFLQNIISVKLKQNIKYTYVVDVMFTKNDIRNIVLQAVQLFNPRTADRITIV